MHKYRYWLGYIVLGLIYLFLDAAMLWVAIVDGEILVWFIIGVLPLIAAGLLLFMGLQMVCLEPSGITEYIGPFTLKSLPANQIRTVVKHEIRRNRSRITLLTFSALPAIELEAQGEARLRKHYLFRHSVKFREGKPDWGDLCLGGGFRTKGMPFIDFSEERKTLIQSLYPHAEYREAKRMYDPIGLKK